MPRILDHHEELLDAAAAKFRAVLYKDHFYAGMAHAILLEKMFPETNVRLYLCFSSGRMRRVSVRG